LEGAKQQNLIITERREPTVTVDNIEVAQFVYLLLHNEKIRDLIDTVGKKGVLLLGRFTKGRLAVLERLREKLRSLGFVPMVFNFDKPETKDFSETVRLLCGLSKFVIVDITNPRSSPLELQATVPDYMVPFAPILEQGQEPFAMFLDLLLWPGLRGPAIAIAECRLRSARSLVPQKLRRIAASLAVALSNSGERRYGDQPRRVSHAGTCISTGYFEMIRCSVRNLLLL
jgi:hypothetical protein